MVGLVSYGAYVPKHRLKRSGVAEVLGARGGSGTRAVAGFDEDVTSMAVEAARLALAAGPDSAGPQRVLYATTHPPYLDKTNANTVHAALRLDESALTVDMSGSVRSGVGALLMASEAPVETLVTLSDVRTGLPGGADEREGGDAAAAFLFSPDGPALAELISHATATEEFLDRWRLEGSQASQVWEERFGEHVYLPLANSAYADALRKADLTSSDVDVLAVAGTHSRAVRSFSRQAGARSVVDGLADSVGNTGIAHPGVLLASALDTAVSGQTIALVTLADGVTAMIFRVGDAIGDHTPVRAVAQQVDAGDDSLRYADFLSWRGHLTKEPPRRPDPTGPAAPPSYRSSDYKFGFVACRCEECGFVHLPAVRVCVNCNATDRMTDVPLADKLGTIATFAIDHLAYSPNPPVVAVIVDFDGGGRFRFELTDARPDEVAIGDRVEMTFRRMITADGIHNYFWKARPAGEEI